MQLCSNCGKTHIDGTLFCTNCGNSLEQNNTTPQHAATLLELVVVGNNHRFSFDADTTEILIGRCDAITQFVPDIDLGNDGGYDAGVSRRHAILSLKDGVCLLEDLNSANGTYINDNRLEAHVPTRINVGDNIKFSTLKMHVDHLSQHHTLQH